MVTVRNCRAFDENPNKDYVKCWKTFRPNDFEKMWK